MVKIIIVITNFKKIFSNEYLQILDEKVLPALMKISIPSKIGTGRRIFMWRGIAGSHAPLGSSFPRPEAEGTVFCCNIDLSQGRRLLDSKSTSQ